VQPDARIPPGLTTLRGWAVRQGRTPSYVQGYWRRRPDFPSPVGELPSRGRHGGGRGELLYDESALDEWLAGQQGLASPERIDTDVIDQDERITLSRFAGLIGKSRKTVTQHRGRSGFPEVGEDGLYRAGDLLAYWNARAGRRASGGSS
jgi:hypothetical protein